VNRPATITLAALFLTLGASQALAQGREPPSQEQLQANRDAKYEAEWFTSNDWTADYDVARQRAKEKGKLILAYFLPSYFN
jgi:hypothetical protein